jgi:hypothetical protein
VRSAFSCILALLVPVSVCGADGAAIKRIYVAPMSHLDIGFTDAPSAVAAKMTAMVDQAPGRARPLGAFRRRGGIRNAALVDDERMGA